MVKQRQRKDKVFFSGKEDKHGHGIGFLVHKDIVDTFMGCHPVSSRLIAICLRAVPFNITIVQAYAVTSGYDDNEIEQFYDQLQNVVDQTPKKDILVLVNTFGHYKASRRWTWHSPNRQHNQMDYILERMCFRSGVNSARTRSFPGSDIGSDHDLLMMTFYLLLKRISKPKHTRLKFDLEKLKDPNVLETF